jgi:lysophospholipase L1-like esterase
VSSFAPSARGALLALAVLTLLLAAGPSRADAAAGQPRCAATVDARTRVGDERTIRLGCRGTVLHVQVAEPPLHGIVDRISARKQTLRYRPSQGWSSHDGRRDADEFRLVVENRKGTDTIDVRVDVVTEAPECRSTSRRLPAQGRTVRLQLPCGGLISDPTFRIVERPRHGTVRISQTTGRATYVARAGTRTDRFRYRATNLGGASPVRTVRILAPQRARATARGTGDPGAAPTCTTPPTLSTNYTRSAPVTIACTGTNLTATELSPPKHGELQALAVTGSTVTATYRPDLGYDRRVGAESTTIRVANGAGSTDVTVAVDVRPYRFVAFGDSVTAGFGYYGDGDEMSSFKILSCAPPDPTINGRCSSNSALRGGDTGPAKYTDDFGFANKVSWAAQFAHKLQGGEITAKDGMFANYAVTGSSPGDWLAIDKDRTGPRSYPFGSGALTPTLDKLLAEQPDLVAFTIGANPILSNMLPIPAGEGNWDGCNDRLRWGQTLECLEPLFASNVWLGTHLKALYNYILDKSPQTTFVVMPYHLPVPGLTSFGWDWWQIEAAIDLLNNTIDGAVADVRAARPADANRLQHVEARWNPNEQAPTKLDRFNYGGSSFHLDPPACVPSTVDCRSGGTGDYGWDNKYNCHWFTSNADGPSHQSTILQRTSFNTSTCGGSPWIISTDSGIHPNRAGYERFAAALENLVTQRNLVPALPDPQRK